MKKLLISAALIALAGSAMAQDAMKATAITPAAMAWKDSPTVPGVKTVVLLGDPTKPGDTVVTRSIIPAHTVIPPHTHPYAESLTILKGPFGLKNGNKADVNAETLPTGSYVFNPASNPHYAWTTDSEAIIQVQFVGPASMTYLNPADDPRKVGSSTSPTK